jgi:hypothetical protein
MARAMLLYRRMAAPSSPEDHQPHSPVRDDAALSPHEDLDRQPDGVPHSTIGLTFGFSMILAVLVAIMLASGNLVTRVAAVILVLVAIPVLVSQLRRHAERQRDHLHPSR